MASLMDVFQGGLERYLNIAEARELNDMVRTDRNESYRADHATGTVTRERDQAKIATTPTAPAGIPALWLIGGGLAAVALLVLLLRR